ncbi:MAG: 3-deoxy-D-manno-octulosonic acid transferase [Bacteroidetes bacterium]|nr:MAG: 3-deoxy-D-manno-octulosonic acid transferase [Bacteroidota bacterium]
MIALLYSFGVRLYGAFIRILSPFNQKAQDWWKGRKNQIFHSPPKGKRVVWFHCASLGEFDQGLPLMLSWKEKFPDDYILVSFFSPSGMNHYHKRQHCADQVVYLPLDTKKNARNFINTFSPEFGIFVKYEFWSHHIRAAKQNGMKLYSISTTLRPNQVYFKKYGGYFRETLRQFDHFFVQNERTAALLKSINIDSYTVAGDSRFDKVIANKQHTQNEPLIEAFKGGKELWIIGSSWAIDEKVVLPLVNEIKIKVIIAPHQVDDQHILAIENKLERPFVRFTKANIQDISSFDVLILDTIGQLSNAYRYGDIAYVGGGFTGKLHNILEPAVFGLPVLFGPKHDRFPEADQFLEAGIGFEINESAELSRKLLEALQHKESIRVLAEEFVSKNAGASQKIMTYISSNSEA